MTRFTAVAVLSLAFCTTQQLLAQTVPSQRRIPLWHAALDARSAVKDSTSDLDDLIRAVNAELALGRPDRAKLLLARRPAGDERLERERIVVGAFNAYAGGDYAGAAELFVGASEKSEGQDRGTLRARAGEAYFRAGKADQAATTFRQAREDLPEISGWLALREAQVTRDTSVAFGLLDKAPAAARRLIPRVRGDLFALVGDTARAVVILAGAGHDARAATLALASADTFNARQLTYRGLRSGDTAITNAAIQLATTSLPPRLPEEFITLARAVRRQSPGRAAALLGGAVSAGDSSSRTLALWGDVLTETGSHEAALQAYTRAAHAGGPEATAAEFSQGRALIRLGRPRAASDLLTRFVADHPTHSFAPIATFLLADLSYEAVHRPEADSLYRQVMDRWPEHEYASQARIRLASRALTQGDTARAVRLYGEEVEARGVQQGIARYLLGDLAIRKQDTAAAQSFWSGLVRADSLGYYGSLARGRLGWNPPVVDSVPGHAHSSELDRSLVELDQLDQIGFATEAGALVDWLMAEAGDGDAALDLGEALAVRGRSIQAIALGWRVARTHGMNNPRVLRAIYPWPLRGVVTAEAAEFGVDPYLMAAIVRQESSFDVDARSRAGARGLMQVMPGTARQAAHRMGLDWSDPLLRVPDANLHVGAAHLSILLRHYKGDVVPTLAAYNAGMTPVELWRRFPEARDPALFVERIPYAETRGYVRSVLRNWTIYRALYPPTS